MKMTDTTQNTRDVAIIGMSCLFPGAPDLRTYWQNIVSKVDAVCDPPEDWEAEMVYDPDSRENDRIYCKRGGYLGDLARFDPLKYGVMPNSVDGGEPDHFLALRVAYDALADAGYLDRPVARERVEVVLGRGTYINRGYTTLIQHGLVVDQTLRILKQLHPEHTEEELREIKRELKASLPPFNAESAPGLVPNIVCGRIANRLDFMGPNYTVDAACASSLIALDRGMQDLLSHRCDMAVVGGVHASTPAPILMIFCQLNALSRKGRIRPFSQDADGTLLGEGVGIVVLKRLEDAERDGDRIYARLKSVGVASDGRALGLLAPRVEGEELALRRAYEAAGVSPRTVELIEAHGTGTLVGDQTEIQALGRVFGPRGGESAWCAVGSVKSMISHLIPAAGIAGVIKSALALYHKVLPPTLHCEQPNPKLGLEETPFYINTEARPWIHGAPTPRRAGVNAFGFGGINAHAILEEYTGTPEDETLNYHDRWTTEVCILQGESRLDLTRQCEQLKSYLFAHPRAELKDIAYTLNSRLVESSHRLAVVASDPDQLVQKLDYALRRLADPACVRIKEKSGVYYFEEPLGRHGELAFLFPGEGAQYVNMLSDLCLHFPEVRAQFDLIDRAFMAHSRNYLPSQVIFPPPGAAADRRLWQMDCGPEAVFSANQALLALLGRLDIRPQAVLGHSTGEYSALYASGTIRVDDEEQIIRHILDLNGIYERLMNENRIPAGGLVTVGAVERERVSSIVEQSGGLLHMAMDNCPHQMVICGDGAALAAAVEQLKGSGAVCVPLPFSRPYHTPLFRTFAEHLHEFFRRVKLAPPSVKMYSCMTAGPYPEDVEEIRRLAAEQWARPVRFRETVEAMYEDGVRLFVEVGPRGNLTAFVDDILRGRPYLAVSANVSRHDGITQLNHLVGLLAAHGVALRPEHLYERRSPRRLSFEEEEERADSGSESGSVRLAMGLQPLRLTRERSHESPGERVTPSPAPTPAHAQTTQVSTTPVSGNAPLNGSSPEVMRQYLNTMEQFLSVQQRVMQAFMNGGTPASNGHGIELTAAGVLAPAGGSNGHQPATARAEEENGRKEPSPEVVSAATLSEERSEAFAAEGDAASPEDVGRTLLKLISEKTGYPVEMLDLKQNLEADLGVDSIKRVEIIGAFQQQTGLLPAHEIDRVTSLKTLQQVVDFVTSLNRNGAATPPAPSAAQLPPFPFVGNPTSFVPGEELTALRELNLDEDLFLKDHTLGGRVSVNDESLTALPVMPLTMSMEMLAEAAAALVPGRLLIEIKNIRAHRWITLEKGRVTLRLTARRKASAAAEEVEVQINEVAAVTAGEEGQGITLIEGTAVFGDRYPEPPVSGEFSLRSERPSKWAPEQLYSEGMFHGESFRGVVSVDRWGEDGTEASLEVLPADRLFLSTPEPRFITDPVLLDAAGQLVGYWTAEHLETGFNVFPFRVEALRLFGPAPRRGQRVKCQARIALTGESLVRSDIDLTGPDGRLYARLAGWEDKRFNLPESFYRLRISPRDTMLSTPWPLSVASSAGSQSLVCCMLEGLSDDFLAAHGKIWQNVLAHLVLGRGERETWAALQAVEKRRNDWLRGRAVAKDAVRLFLKQRYGMRLCPADIEIAKDEHGRPHARGPWAEGLEAVPVVSLAHADGIAVALAGDGARGRGVGIDIEPLGRVQAGFESAAFTHEELELLSSGDGRLREEQALRLWCAKEAVAKALGRGMLDGPRCLAAKQLDARTGVVEVSLSGELARRFPESAATRLTAHTAREGNLVVACSLIKGVDHAEHSDGSHDGNQAR
jgi:acyl transferase domain-containing protein/4'-phosphopantetheinyl transferase EntD